MTMKYLQVHSCPNAFLRAIISNSNNNSIIPPHNLKSLVLVTHLQASMTVVRPPKDIKDWLQQDDEDTIMKNMLLQRQVVELQHILVEKELELYCKYMHFPIDFVKERARETCDQRQQEGVNDVDDLTTDTVLEYLQEHCHALIPSSLTIAVDYFKQELEKVRNKTKKQIRKSRWDKLTEQERTLITGKYVFQRCRLEDLKKRNAKIQWDKLQNEFDRYGKDNWESISVNWLLQDRHWFEQRKKLESMPNGAISDNTTNDITTSENTTSLMADHAELLLIHSTISHHLIHF
ncbi:hypothetical protein BC941DRAFT_519356 [Chlamydoabsidia padenii]|nr:hypothetical protein BC941DRAFT_519356 [Chlamydoabsidia padenii]